MVKVDFETAQKSFLSVERKKSFRGKSKKKEFFKERSGNLLKTIDQSEAEMESTI